MQLINDPDELKALIEANAPAHIIGDDYTASEWLDDPANFALRIGNDLGMCEATGEWPGPLMVHVLYESRGKRALENARAMLKQCFDYGATEILGETPATLPHAVRFARMLGFEIIGEAERPMGKVILSRLIRTAQP